MKTFSATGQQSFQQRCFYLFPLLFGGSMKQFFFGDFHSYTHGCRDLKGLPKKSKKLLEGDRRSVCIRVFWYQSKGSSMSIAKHCKHCQTVNFLSFSCRIFRPHVNRKPAVLAFALCVKVESTLMGLRSPARFSSVGFWDRFDEDPVWSYLRNVQIHSPPGLLPRRYQADLGWPWYHWPGPVRGWDGISMCFLQVARESMPLKIFEVFVFDCTMYTNF